MAKRLEDLAERNRKIAEGLDTKSPYLARQQKRFIEELETIPSTPPAKPAQTAAPPVKEKPAESLPSFFIQDRELEEMPLAARPRSPAKMREGFVDVFDAEEENWDVSDDEMPIPPALQSQAERELYQALLKNKRKAANGGRT